VASDPVIPNENRMLVHIILGDPMNFTDAVKSVLTLNYANFNGRASRSEYWWYVLFAFIASFVLQTIDGWVLGFALLGTIFSLATIIPGIAVGVRRLHDIGKSGWWLLIALTVIGIVLLIYWHVQPSEGDNEYGPTPAA
jgi:uncharacterized membrane protein YhaH (DUF805 family)